MTAIGWIRITSDGTGALDRIQVPGGWLYLSLSEDRRERAMTFVPVPAEPSPTVEVTAPQLGPGSSEVLAAADEAYWQVAGRDASTPGLHAAITAALRAMGLRP